MQQPLSFKRVLLITILGIGVLIGYSVFASSKDDIVYPVAELGGCVDENECRAYCDDVDHLAECLDFAELHNLLSDEDLEHGRRFEALGAVGPGGCRAEDECEAYCEDVSNIDECLAFAEQHGFMDSEELKEARRIAQALREGAQLPGGCRSERECEAYCEDPAHMRECIEFAEAAGLFPPEELEEARRVLTALEAGAQLPGGCRNEDECEAYCQDPVHIEECLDFAEAAGLIPPDELEEARRIAPIMARGGMPGGCISREECEAYCEQEENIEECIAFFVEAGFITPEEAEIFRKTGGQGPGDCHGEEECEAYCNDPANQEQCFAFAKEHGLIPEEDLEHLEDGLNRLRTELEQAPPEVTACLRAEVGTENFDQIVAGTLLPGPDIGDKIRLCFEQFFVAPEGFEGREGEEGFFPEKSPEQQACMEEILAGNQGLPTPEQEQRIAQECFGAGGGFLEHFIPEGFEEEVHPGDFGTPPEGFEEEFQQRFEEQFQQQIEQQIQQQIEEETQRQIEEQIRQQIHEESGGAIPPDTTVEPELQGSMMGAFSIFLKLLGGL